MRSEIYLWGGLVIAACFISPVTNAQETHSYGRFGTRTLGGTLAPRERSRFEGGIQRSPSGSIIGPQRDLSRFGAPTPRARALEDFAESLRWPPPTIRPRVPVDPAEPREPAVAPAFPRRLPADIQQDPRLLSPRVPAAREAPARVPAPREPMPRVPASRESVPRQLPDTWFRSHPNSGN